MTVTDGADVELGALIDAAVDERLRKGKNEQQALPGHGPNDPSTDEFFGLSDLEIEWRKKDKRRIDAEASAAKAEQERQITERLAEEERRLREWASNTPIREAARERLAELRPKLYELQAEVLRLEREASR